ncbi:hypothetical protein [Bosea sp. BH3]|uniref:hypothetical protein n=1 Tax=Bosea sp. BH3 TaxID=2871701 RepID=UPI0021CB6FAE|nr:hypothetical protein [Bosea sp. BH3]MCU4178959.1 hypothetical protein [Bosea sp. BH3]
MVRAPSPSRLVAGAAFVAAAMLGGNAAEAGGGCRGAACYQLVKTPPVYKTVTKTYKVRPIQRRHRVVPAKYEIQTESVMVQPEARIAHTRPAVLGSVTEKVMLSPATRRWEVTTDAFGQTVGCWVDVPAQYGYQSRIVEMVAGSTYYETVPAVYEERQRRVMVRPTYVVREERAAGYRTQRRQVLVSPGSKYWTPIN